MIVTEAMIEAARKAVRYHLPEVEARRIYIAMHNAAIAQGIDARSGETERLDPKGESPVAESDAP